ncbi:MAG: beta-ketoacyl-[acyl-carrier-protein] synthase family protein [Nanoarchaeota archaeon]
MTRKVVITGLGPVTPIGIGKNDLWRAVQNEVYVCGPAKSNDFSKYGNLQTAEIHDFDLSGFFQRDLQAGKFDKKLFNRVNKECDKAIQFGVLATKLALEDSHLDYNPHENSIAVYLGNADGCVQLYEKQIELAFQGIIKKIFDSFSGLLKPFSLFKARRAFKEYASLFHEENLPEFVAFLHEKYGTIHQLAPTRTIDFKLYSIPARVASMFSLHGPSMAVNSACASGLDAIGQAFHLIKSGYSNVDIAVCGGSEAPISLEVLAALDNLGVISKTRPCPYDEYRDGFALGEGAGMIVLEELEHAKKRNAKIYAEVAGYSQSNDAGRNITVLHPEGKFLKKAIESAISEAGISREEVTYINSHGTATQDCDKVETVVVKSVFGDHAYNLNISSTKPMTGHSFGAVGGIESIITSLAISSSVVPPTLNLENQSPECDLNYTPNHAVDREIPAALITSMGFGGYNSALVLKKL